ncbi:MAG: SpoIIE family protein phosphatase [Planctomycetaceae bacterium]|nr:SpoIIE family protein phosphatase [Planctomycetaceae bacterium]
MSQNLLTASNVILDSLSDGVYVCDTDRRIVFWSRAAARITGWQPDDVVGRRCLDDVLCHIDKDGHRLCGEEFCPLHRAMVTGTTSTVGLIVFAQGKDGHRVPMEVTVAPIRDSAGHIVGGVETFRDVSHVLADLERAKRIQSLSLEIDLPDDPRVGFSTHYVPHDLVGGDFYAIKPLDADHYGFLLADVMGHGVAAALHTMHLSSLWDRHYRLLTEPVLFAQMVNNELARVVKGESFATGLCGIIDANDRVLRAVSAGGPPGLAFRDGGRIEELQSAGLPFGMMEDADYEETEARFDRGDCLLFFSDGATEVHNAAGQLLGTQGLVRVLRETGYPAHGLHMSAVEEQLLLYSNEIRLSDDLTFIDVRF